MRASRGWSVTGLVVDNSSDQGDGNATTWTNVITVNGKGLDPSWSSKWLMNGAQPAALRTLTDGLIELPLHRHFVAERRAIDELW